MIQLLFYAVAALVLVIGAAVLVRLYPWLMFLGLASLTWTATGGTTSPLIDADGLQIYGGDILAVVAGAAAAAHLGRVGRNLGVKAPAAALLTALLAINFIKGWQTFGVAAANEFRVTLYLLAVTVFVLSLDLTIWRPRIVRYYVWLSLALSALAAYRWLTTGFGTSSELLLIAGELRTTRALLAPQALVIAVGAIVSLYAWAETKRRSHLLLGGWFIAVVVLLQHRSVWAALAAGVIVGAVSVRFELRRRVLAALLVGVVLIGPALVLASGSSAVSNVAESASAASLSSGTFKFRSDGWKQLIEGTQDKGYPAVLFGEPFGTSLARIINGQIVTVSAHNFYIATYLRAGVVGLTALIFMFIMIRTGGWAPRVALGVALGVYGIAYSVDHLSAPAFALLFVAAQTRKRQAVAGPPGDLVEEAAASPAAAPALAGAGVRPVDVSRLAEPRAAP